MSLLTYPFFNKPCSIEKELLSLPSINYKMTRL